MEELRIQLEAALDRIATLERQGIQLDIDPTTTLYLSKPIDARIALQPSQTYSTSGPSGTAVKGSVWFQDTGVLATRAIYANSGSGWIQFK